MQLEKNIFLRICEELSGQKEPWFSIIIFPPLHAWFFAYFYRSEEQWAFSGGCAGFNTTFFFLGLRCSHLCCWHVQLPGLPCLCAPTLAVWWWERLSRREWWAIQCRLWYEHCLKLCVKEFSGSIQGNCFIIS